MALSGNVAVRATSQNNLIFYWEAVQSVASNQSVVSWQLLLEAGTFGRIDATPGSPWSATVAGKAFSGTSSLAIGNNETKVLASGSVTVNHAEDGTGSFSYSFSQEFWIDFDNEYITVVSGSGSAELDTIARVSHPSVSSESVYMGESLHIYTNRPSGSGLTHTLTYRFLNASGTIEEDVGDDCKWIPNIELARQIPNTPDGTAAITCTTYANGSFVGSDTTYVKLIVPESVIPTVSATLEDTSGAYRLLDSFVKNISMLKVNVTTAGAYGSKTMSPSFTLNGKNYIEGSIITEEGELSLVVSVSDSRGRTGVAVCPLTVADYSPPSLTISASRCTADGYADDTGDHARITVTGYITQVNGCNTGNLILFYGSTYEEVSLGTGDVFYQTDPFYADVDATINIDAVLSDKLVSAPRTMVLSTGYATLDLLAGGKGISFGKAATREGFDCAMPAYFSGGIYEIKTDGSIDSRSLFDRVAALEALLQGV